MKRILCYGDSNTWGTRPDGLGRWEKRWPISLKEELGEECVIIEEGCGGRTTVWDDPLEMHKNGRTYLLPCLHSHRPLDAVVIALGTNDLKCRFSLTPYDIAAGAGELAKEVLRCEYGHGYPCLLYTSLFTGPESSYPSSYRSWEAGRTHFNIPITGCLTRLF